MLRIYGAGDQYVNTWVTDRILYKQYYSNSNDVLDASDKNQDKYLLHCFVWLNRATVETAISRQKTQDTPAHRSIGALAGVTTGPPRTQLQYEGCNNSTQPVPWREGRAYVPPIREGAIAAFHEKGERIAIRTRLPVVVVLLILLSPTVVCCTSLAKNVAYIHPLLGEK